MWYRSLGILRAMAAFMLLIAVTPQQLCLHCFIDSIAMSSGHAESCECCGNENASNDGSTDEPSNRGSNHDKDCPSCIGKLLNPSWSPSAGTDLPDQELFTAFVLPLNSLADMLCSISMDHVLRPSCFQSPALRLRI